MSRDHRRRRRLRQCGPEALEAAISHDEDLASCHARMTEMGYRLSGRIVCRRGRWLARFVWRNPMAELTEFRLVAWVRLW